MCDGANTSEVNEISTRTHAALEKKIIIMKMKVAKNNVRDEMKQIQTRSKVIKND